MKPLFRALLVVALPATLTAQQAPAGPPKDPITTSFRTRSAALRRNLAQAFDSIPAAKFGYKPTPSQLTIGYIAQHLASDSYLFCSAFGPMKPALEAKDITTPDSVKATWPREELITKLKESFAFCDAAAAQLSDANIGEITEVKMGANTRSVPRVNMALGHALDLADHYSQIANYMRLNGMLPPTALPRPPRP